MSVSKSRSVTLKPHLVVEHHNSDDLRRHIVFSEVSNIVFHYLMMSFVLLVYDSIPCSRHVTTQRYTFMLLEEDEDNNEDDEKSLVGPGTLIRHLGLRQLDYDHEKDEGPLVGARTLDWRSGSRHLTVTMRRTMDYW
jgi:hypothetical protein